MTRSRGTPATGLKPKSGGKARLPDLKLLLRGAREVAEPRFHIRRFGRRACPRSSIASTAFTSPGHRPFRRRAASVILFCLIFGAPNTQIITKNGRNVTAAHFRNPESN